MRGVFTDIRLGRIIEMTEKRTKIEVISFLQQLPNSQNIKIVTIDMCTTYREAVFEVLPHARVVIDKFHVIKMAVAALENIRKQMNGTVSKRERSHLLHLRYLLLANYESLSEEQHLRLKVIFSDYPCFELPYLLKEELREMYKSKTTADAIRLFELWKDHIPPEMTDFVEISKTIYRWRKEIFSYFDCRVANATTESLNNLIKCIQRQARGYTFEVLRTKVLYGTKATKKAAYSFSKPKSNSSKTMFSYEYGVGNDLYQTKMLVTGTGTDINELIEVFEDGDF